MSIGKLPLIGATVVGTVGTVGGGYFVLTRDNGKREKPSSLKDKYKLAVLVSDSDWNKKFDALKIANPVPVYGPLKEAYDRKDTESEAKVLHQKACKSIYALPQDTTTHLEEFTKYCFFNNLDKAGVGKSLASQDSDFQTQWSTFSSKKKEELSPELIEAFENKGSDSNHNTWKQKMVLGCKKLSEKIYVGDNLDFSSFCLKN